MQGKPDWLNRLRATLEKPMPFPGWKRFWVGAGVTLGAFLIRPRRGDTFYFWIDFGVMAFALAIYALAVLLETKKPPTEAVGAGREDGPSSISSGGIDVWMPLSLLALFLLGGFIWGVLTAR